MISIIIFNLLVGIVINLSTKIQKCEESSINIYQLNDIQNVWSEFDKNGTGYINYKDFWIFLSRISLTLGMQVEELRNIDNKKKFLKILNLPIYENVSRNNIYSFKFQEVVLVLSKISVMMKFGISQYLIKILIYKYNFYLNRFEIESSETKIKILRSKRERKKYLNTVLQSGSISSMVDFQSSIRNWLINSKNRPNK